MKYTYTTQDNFTFDFTIIKQTKTKTIILTESPIGVFTISNKELKKAKKCS
jgi:hypothetical protein